VPGFNKGEPGIEKDIRGISQQKKEIIRFKYKKKYKQNRIIAEILFH